MGGLAESARPLIDGKSGSYPEFLFDHRASARTEYKDRVPAYPAEIQATHSLELEINPGPSPNSV